MSDDKKKWVLLALLIVLTFSLIYVFRMKGLGRFVREQGKNLTSFYTANLRPLIAQIPFTNDDIFNFAFHKRLPLNYEKNKYLVLGSEQGGGGYFEFAKDLPDNAENLDAFASTMGLNKEQKSKVDSILGSYRDRLEEQVLINDKNTMAINSGLWNLNRAILADVLSYTQKVSKSKMAEIASIDHSMFNDPALPAMIKDVKAARDNNYIFVTPDSVFNGKFKFDNEKFKHSLAQVEKNAEMLNKRLSELDFNLKFDNHFVEKNKRSSNEFNIKVDTDVVKIQIPKTLDIPVPIPSMEIITREINNSIDKGKKVLTKNRKLNNKPDDFTFRMKVGDGGEPFELNIHIPNVDSIVRANEGNIDDFDFSFNSDEDEEETNYKTNAFHKKIDELNAKLTDIRRKVKDHPEKAKLYQKEIDRLNKELKDTYSKNSK